jgi:rod shape-determining protein MreD
MRSDFRWLIISGGNFILILLTTQLNHYLSSLSLYLFLLGLPISFAGLSLSLRNGIISTAITGLLIDAITPLPYGIHFILCLTSFTIIYVIRSRIPSKENIATIIVTLLTNLVLFFAVTCYVYLSGFNSSFSPLHIVSDLIASQLVLIFITHWFFAFQPALLKICGFSPTGTVSR